MARKQKPKPRRKKSRRRSPVARRPVRRITKKSRKATKKPSRHPRLGVKAEAAIQLLNRGRSFSATARTLRLPIGDLQRALKRKGLAHRRGKRWVFKDSRLRRVQIITKGRTRNLGVQGYAAARLIGEYHNAVARFLRTNNPKELRRFVGRVVEAANGRTYVLETDPNELHRIAAMDTPAFHEIYQITSNT